MTRIQRGFFCDLTAQCTPILVHTPLAAAAHLAHVNLKVVHNGSQGVTLLDGVVVAPAVYTLKRRQKPSDVACPRRVRVQVEGSSIGWVAGDAVCCIWCAYA
jgi:hypothetical protein